MTKCDRCGPVAEGVTVKETAYGTLCRTCYDWIEEHEEGKR